jgi:drug/metabolite transporter (DMT)-like permease
VDGLDLCGGQMHLPAWLVVLVVVLTYGCLSVGFNLYNSFLLRIIDGFKFPVVYTTTHMLAGFTGASVLIFGFKAGTVSWDRFSSKWRPLLLLACLRSGTIVLNNWSLVLIDLTLNKVIKSTVPVFVVFFSIVVEKKKYSWQIILTLMFLILGTILSCLHSTANGNNPIGVMMAIGSSAVGGGGIVMSALLLGRDHDLSPVELLFYFSPLQSVLLFTLSLFTEASEFVEWAGNNAGAASGFIFAGAGLAFAFNLTGFCLVQTTSATTTAICGNVVVVIVIVLGSFFLQVEATPINIVGYCVSTIAAIVYVGINLYQKKQQAALEAKSPVVGVAVK